VLPGKATIHRLARVLPRVLDRMFIAVRAEIHRTPWGMETASWKHDRASSGLAQLVIEVENPDRDKSSSPDVVARRYESVY
jgi:hypothetical protein